MAEACAVRCVACHLPGPVHRYVYAGLGARQLQRLEHQHDLESVVLASQFAKAARTLVLLLEERADGLVRENIVEAAMLAPADERGMQRLVVQRLCNMYGRRRNEPELVRSMEDSVAGQLLQLPPDAREQELPDVGAADSIDWEAWLGLYRRCLAEAVESHGLSGDPFTNATELGTDRVDSRRLGDLPGGGIDGRGNQ